MSDISQVQSHGNDNVPAEKDGKATIQTESEHRQILQSRLDDIFRRISESCQVLREAHFDAANVNGGFRQNEEAKVRPLVDQYSRGQQPYCTYRCQRLPRAYGPSSGCPCTCDSIHERRSARDWSSTPAEIDEWIYELPNGGHPTRTTKVKFADPLVTEVHEFIPWYCEEYVYSDRYWSKGFPYPSLDKSTPEEDDTDIAWQEAHARLTELEAEWAREELLDIREAQALQR